MNSGLPVVCLGEALVDRLGPPGGDPAIDGPVDDRLGGAPANVACGLARLGSDAAFLGRLGADAIGDRFATLFRQRAVDFGAVQWDAQRLQDCFKKRSKGENREYYRDGNRHNQHFQRQSGAPVIAKLVPAWSHDQRVVLVPDRRQEGAGCCDGHCHQETIRVGVQPAGNVDGDRSADNRGCGVVEHVG